MIYQTKVDILHDSTDQNNNSYGLKDTQSYTQHPYANTHNQSTTPIQQLKDRATTPNRNQIKLHLANTKKLASENVRDMKGSDGYVTQLAAKDLRHSAEALQDDARLFV